MVFAAAPSQSEMISSLLAIRDIPWDRITAFHMDDYLDLPSDAPQRSPTGLTITCSAERQSASCIAFQQSGLPRRFVGIMQAACRGADRYRVSWYWRERPYRLNDPPVADFDDPAMVKVVELDATCRNSRLMTLFCGVGGGAKTGDHLTVPQLIGGPGDLLRGPGASEARRCRGGAGWADINKLSCKYSAHTSELQNFPGSGGQPPCLKRLQL